MGEGGGWTRGGPGGASSRGPRGCWGAVRAARVPKKSQNKTPRVFFQAAFDFDSPRDLSFSLKPMPGNSGKLYLTCASESIMNAVVPGGADLTTYLDIIFPNNDSFKHGKVIDETNKTEVPFYSIVLKQETIFSVRALRVGKLK